MTEINLEFLAEQQRRILDEMRQMRGEMQTMRDDMKFIRSDHNFLRHDLTGAVLRLDAIDEKFSVAVERLHATGEEQRSQGLKLQFAVDQIDVIAQHLVQVLAILRKEG